MMDAGRHLSILSYILLLPLWRAGGSLVAVYSVQRHGARNVLPKGIFLTEDALVGGPTLLPEGQRQTYDAGAKFRARYLDNATCKAWGTCLPGVGNGIKYGVLNQPAVGFGNFDVYARSSSLDRALLSGQCFFNGIFPPDPTTAANSSSSYMPNGAQPVPIFSQSDSEDLLIRAYTKCNTYTANLQTWFASEEFAAKARASAALRAEVAMRMPGTDTSLHNWWNVYDAINVFRSYGVGNPVYAFDDAMFKKIQDLAYWLETSKMRSNLTGNLLGGVALADLVSYLRAAAAAHSAGSQAYYRLLSLSGHYNTQLGILAALELDEWPPAANFTWLTGLPKLAALMAFELHAVQAVQTAGASGSSYYLRLVYQDGPAASYGTVPLPCALDAAAATVGAGACNLAEFLSYAAARAINSSAAWCAACDNWSLSACAAAQLAELRAAVNANSGSGGGGGGTEPWKIAVSVVVTFVGTVFLAVGLAWLWSRRQGRHAPAAAEGWGAAGPHAEIAGYSYTANAI